MRQLLQANADIILLFQNKLTAREHSIFSKLNQRFEHFSLTWKMTIQSGLGNTHSFSQDRRRNPGPRIGFKEFNQGVKNCLSTVGFLISHGRVTALWFIVSGAGHVLPALAY